MQRHDRHLGNDLRTAATTMPLPRRRSPTGWKPNCTPCWNNSTPDNPEHTGHRRRAAVILITARAALAAGAACLCLTVIQESGDLWRYTLSKETEPRNSRLAYGRVIVPGHIAALRRAAEICAGGYQPGSTERGLLEQFAAGHASS
jgi:hypothetical protein